jgi:hypothetical protein
MIYPFATQTHLAFSPQFTQAVESKQVRLSLSTSSQSLSPHSASFQSPPVSSLLHLSSNPPTLSDSLPLSECVILGLFRSRWRSRTRSGPSGLWRRRWRRRRASSSPPRLDRARVCVYVQSRALKGRRASTPLRMCVCVRVWRSASFSVY